MVKVNELIKTDNIIKVSPENTLASALSKLSTSHDAAFVFSKDDKYLGVINPYHALIKSSLPGNSKVGNCLFHPPHVYLDYPNSKIAHLMDESKVHYLPVFNHEEKFLGIVSARRLFTNLQQAHSFKIPIKEALSFKKQNIITINENDTIQAALNVFKSSKVSKLIVVDKSRKLKGILSYYDLISYLIAPKDKLRWGQREGDKVNFYNQRVKNFAKTYVLTLKESDQLQDALALILEMKIGSVVIVNDLHQPIGIVTTKDFLKNIMRDSSQKKIELIAKNLSHTSRHVLGGFFYRFQKRLNRLPDVAKARLLVKEEKNGGLYKVALSLIPKRGEPQIIKKEGRNLLEVLRKIKK